MRRNTKRLGMLGAEFTMALAGLIGTAQAKGETLVTSQNVNEVAKTNHERKKAKEEININGGLDFPTHYPGDYGLSHKEYGLRYGTGKSRKCKSNRLRFTHNAKLRRRAV